LRPRIPTTQTWRNMSVSCRTAWLATSGNRI